MKIRKVLNTEFSFVMLDTPIIEALQIMSRENAVTLYVVGDDMTFLGVLTDKNVLKLLYEVQDKKESLVIDYMSPNIANFSVDDMIVDACDYLIETDYGSIPVLESNRLIGIVTRTDIVKYILSLRRHSATLT